MTEWIVTSSALILIIIALRGLLKQKLRPTVRYALWGLVLVRLLIPFSFAASPISVENITQGVKQEASAAVTQYETTYDQVIQQYAQMGITVTPAQAREEARQQVYTDTYSSIADRYAQSGISVPEQQLQQEARQQTQSASFLALLTNALPLIWYAGMVLMALALLGSNGWFAWNLGRSSTSLSQPGFPLQVFETGYTATPCLFGLVRPTVYLTPEAARDPVMRRHVLAHELTHYRHGDHIWSVLRGVCLILHWYNPLVWIAAILSRKDAELACDEATIRTLGEEERIAYGRTLIGMTCIRHDPKSFLVTATTMIGSKKSLKERIAAIARKPRNALYAIIACILVASIAVGCTFTGANKGLTREEAWEKVLSAVEGYNSRDHYHITMEVFYDFSDDTLDGGLTNEFYQTKKSEIRITALAEYVEWILIHNSNMFYYTEDNEWVDFGEYDRFTDLSFEIPTEENLVLSWKNEGSQLVVVCDYSYQEPDEYAHMDPTVTFWLNTDGSLAKYELHYGVDEDNGPDYIVTQTLTVHADDAAGVNRKIEAVYKEASNALDLDPDQTTPTTEPVTEPPISAELFPFIYRDDPSWDYWREYIGPNDCTDGYLYVQDRATMEITMVLDAPVKRFVEIQDQLFCVMQDGRILQVDYTGANQRTLYQASGKVSDIFHLNSKLYFNDGTELTVLDLDTLTPSVVGSFTDYQTIYAVTETWLWLNIGGTDYAYDTATGDLVQFQNSDALNRFLEGEWPGPMVPVVYYPFTDQEIADAAAVVEEYVYGLVPDLSHPSYVNLKWMGLDPQATYYDVWDYIHANPDTITTEEAFSRMMTFTVRLSYLASPMGNNPTPGKFNDFARVVCIRDSIDAPWAVHSFSSGGSINTLPMDKLDNFQSIGDVMAGSTYGTEAVILYLRNEDRQSVEVVSLDESYLVPYGQELTEDELASINDLFGRCFDEENWRYGMALSSQYFSPADVDLSMFFYNYDYIWHQELTQEELDYLIPYFGEDWVGVVCDSRVPTAVINEIMMDTFGITVDQTNGIGTEGFVYFPETDCYYFGHTDAYQHKYVFHRGIRKHDGTIALYYWDTTYFDNPDTSWKNDWINVLTIQPKADGSGYTVLSNVPTGYRIENETGVLPLPEDYTLADVVTAYEENLSWECGLGHFHDTPFSIPVIYPFSQDAITVQKEIYSDWMPWLEDQKMIAEYAADPSWIFIEHETSLNENILSIIIHVWWDSGSHTYQIYNFDLSTGSYLGPAEMARRFLHISYPEFLMAVSEYRMDELQATQPNSDMREYMAKYVPDVAEMDQATLYLDKDGNICLRYDSLDIGGAMFYPTVKPFSLKQVDWDPASREEAYQWLFGIEIPNNFWFENNISDYWAMIQNAYKADPVEFQSQLSRADAGTQQRITDLLAQENPDPYAE